MKKKKGKKLEKKPKETTKVTVVSKAVKDEYFVKLSKEELQNSRVRQAIINLLDLRLGLKRFAPFYRLSSAEFELIKNTSSFVEKKKYGKTKFDGEIGKYRGKRLVVE